MAAPTSSKSLCASSASTSVPSTPFPRGELARKPVLTPIQNRTRKAKRALAARGLVEAVTWSFVSKREAELFGGGSAALALANPIAAELSDMRPSLIPGLAMAAQKNADRGLADAALFEVGQIFKGDQPADQLTAATGVRRALAKTNGIGRHWSSKVEAVDASVAKPTPSRCWPPPAPRCRRCKWCRGRGLVPSRPQRHYPIGPQTCSAISATTSAYFEALPKARWSLSRSRWIKSPSRRPRRRAPSRCSIAHFQPVERDSPCGREQGEGADIVRAALGVDRPIAGITVFDVYEGKGIDPARNRSRSRSPSQPREKTMTDQEIDALGAKIVAEVSKRTGGVLRG